MSAHGDSSNHEKSTLKELVTQLRECCKATSCLQGSDSSYPYYTYFEEELQIFKEFAEVNNLYLPEPPSILSSPPDEEGNEHQVWFQPANSTFYKVTWPDHFGMLVVHRHDEHPAASPIQYLERWLLHNQLFGDSVEFVGALRTPQGLRLVITQPAIKGEPATEQEIHQFFTSSGWMKFSTASDIAYLDPTNNCVISDTHAGNIISVKAPPKLLLPIDLRVQQLEGAMIDSIRKICRI